MSHKKRTGYEPQEKEQVMSPQEKNGYEPIRTRTGYEPPEKGFKPWQIANEPVVNYYELFEKRIWEKCNIDWVKDDTMKDLSRAMKILSSYSEGRFGTTFTNNLGF
jgi:hypothetical protein